MFSSPFLSLAIIALVVSFIFTEFNFGEKRPYSNLGWFSYFVGYFLLVVSVEVVVGVIVFTWILIF